MIKVEDIKAVVEQAIAGTDMFVVEVKVTPDNRIEVSLDSMQGVDIDSCVAVSRFIENAINRDDEDYELMVASAGLTEPLRELKQFEKNLGKEVEVLFKNGQKQKGILRGITDTTITLEYQEKQLLEGKKRKHLVSRVEELSLDSIKHTKLVINVR